MGKLKPYPEHDTQCLRLIAQWMDGAPGRHWAAAFLRRIADDIERRATDGQWAGVPDGWKLVPVEPTPEMWAAVNKLDDEMAAGGYDGKGCSIEQAWHCLLAAAPTPPAGDAGQERPAAQATTRRMPWWVSESGMCEREAHCECGGDTVGVRETCANWKKRPGAPLPYVEVTVRIGDVIARRAASREEFEGSRHPRQMAHYRAIHAVDAAIAASKGSGA